MIKPKLTRDDSDERQGWWLGERFIPDGDEPALTYNLKRVPTEDMLAELSSRGIRHEDLPWEDCGECNYIRGLKDSGICGAGRKPIWFPRGLDDDDNPHTVGFYAIACDKRKPLVPPDESQQDSAGRE